jgi:hypothetical protein
MGSLPSQMKETAMYTRKILLAAAALAVAGMTETAGAAPSRAFQKPVVAREQIFTTLHLHHYGWLSDPYFLRGHYVVRSLDPFGRVVLVEINPQNGAFIGEILI